MEVCKVMKSGDCKDVPVKETEISEVFLMTLQKKRRHLKRSLLA